MNFIIYEDSKYKLYKLQKFFINIIKLKINLMHQIYANECYF